MLAATREKMSDSEKEIEQEHVRPFLHKTCNQEVSGRFTFGTLWSDHGNVHENVAEK